jgi:hypothetical protein
LIPAPEPSPVSQTQPPSQEPPPRGQTPLALVINEVEGWILFDDDSEALIDLWIDAFGCETEDSLEAIAVVGRYSRGPSVGGFVALDLRDFVPQEVIDG